jgi:ABC-type transporter Mla subunit MlaD
MATAMRSRSAGARESDASQFLKKWITVWVALLAIVTLVVVVFLVTITNSLASINGSLAVADDAVTGAGGDVKTLPSEVDTVNASLAGIDPNLKPIPGQADAIIAALTSINSKLTTTDGSLKDTTSVLSTVLNQTGDIRGVLVDADDAPDKLGVQNIHQRVAFANGTGNTGSFGTNPSNLQTAKGDTGVILGQLQEINKHLRGICRNPAVLGAKVCG